MKSIPFNENTPFGVMLSIPAACLTVEEIPTADRKALVRYLRYDQQVVGKPATSVTFDNLDAAEAYMETCQQQYLMRYCGAVTIQDND